MELFAGVPTLDLFQYNVVDNFFSLTVATMGAAAIFFFLARGTVAPKYQPALMVSGIVVALACYHYFMIRMSWHGAYEFQAGVGGAAGSYVPSGKPFNDFYRYADWILTVPLLMVELVTVLALAKAVARPLLAKLVIAAALMIGLGYPGEVISDPDQWSTRVGWGVASTIPFLYILYVLWVELTRAITTQPKNVQTLLEVARLVLLVTWAVYPIAYAFGGTPEALAAKSGRTGPEGSAITGANGEVILQIGYAIADITAKAGFGLLIYFIARAKSENLTESERAEARASATIA